LLISFFSGLSDFKVQHWATTSWLMPSMDGAVHKNDAFFQQTGLKIS